MLKPSIQDMVFRRTIPHPKQNDPTSFFAHVQRNLVPEVRLEVQTFYGSLNCIEAQYPGLDYTFAPHRRRLARYPWHRRLFRVFDDLRLTENEILSLCQWEGTRSAKERYEVETKRTIRDTTADDVVAAPQGHGPRARVYWLEGVNWSRSAESAKRANVLNGVADVEQSDEDDSNTSVGEQLNQQLQTATETYPGIEQLAMDAQWEQWMKEALERNELDRNSLFAAIREGYTLPTETTSSGLYPSTIPTDLEQSASNTSPENISQPPIAQRYHDLRAMLQDLQSANNQLSAENAALAMFLSRSQTEVTQ